jgi:signal transduction histidine kinase
VDLRELTGHGIDQIRLAADQKQQHLSAALGPDAVEIDVDTARFGQVLSNVLTNAVKYTPVGGSITVTVGREGTDGVVRVSDTGAGIAPEALDHLFGLFVRASADAGGLGIGLAVAKRLVEMHGGSIAVRSDGLGRGTEFVLRWPMAGHASDYESSTSRTLRASSAGA